MLLFFCLAQALITACLVLVVSVRLTGSVESQSGTIVREVEDHQEAQLLSQLRLLRNLIRDVQKEIVWANDLIVTNPWVPSAIASFDVKSLLGVLQPAVKSAGLGFTLLYDLDGILVASHPRDVNDIASARMFETWALRDALEIGQEEGTPGAFEGVSLLPSGFLEAHGLAALSESPGGALAVLAARSVFDDFGDPVGYAVSGRLLEGLNGPSKQLLAEFGTSSAVYRGKVPVAWAGFTGREGAPPTTGQDTRDDSLKLAAVPGAGAEGHVRLSVGSRAYFGALASLADDLTGVSVGSLLAAVPEEEVLALSRLIRREGELTTAEVRLWILALGIAAVTLFFLVTLWVTSSAIVRPLAGVVGTLRDIADGRGDLTRTLEVRSRDEIGELARCFNRFVERLRRMVCSSLEVAVDLAAAAGSISTSSHAAAQGARTQAETLENSVGALQEISQEVTAVADSTGQLVRLADSTSASTIQMGTTAEGIAGQVEQLFSVIEEVSASTHEMSQATQQIMANTEGLTASSQQTAASLAQMAANISQIETNAEVTDRLAEEAHQDALQGREAVAASVDGIQALSAFMERFRAVATDLGSRSSAIAKILSVIEEVTDQTSLLALNAAIIAAQAGEHGRGFAVVADEIRDLAERTAESTKEISSLLDHLQTGTREAVSAMEEGRSRIGAEVERSNAAALALEKILESTARSREEVRSIAVATQDQSRASAQVSAVMEEISDTLGTIAATLQQHSGGAQQLAAATEAMKEIASAVRYSTGEQVGGSRNIEENMDQVLAMIESISRATLAQQERTARVLEAVSSVQRIAEENAGRTARLDEIASSLQGRSAALQRELGAFEV